MFKTLLFAPETFNFAEVTRCIEVARRLPGIRCVFAGFSERFTSPIREAGFEYRSLKPVLTDAEGKMAIASTKAEVSAIPSLLAWCGNVSLASGRSFVSWTQQPL